MSYKGSVGGVKKGTESPIPLLGIGRFPERLKIIVEEASSVRSYADASGLSEGVVRKYLKGASFPTLDRIEMLAVAGKVSVEWLATGKGPMRTCLMELFDRLITHDDYDLDLPEAHHYYQDYMSGLTEAETPDELDEALSPSIRWVFKSKNIELSDIWVSWLATLSGRHHLGWDELQQLAELMQDKGDLDDEFAMIPGFNVEVAAGTGAFPNGEQATRKLAFRHKWLKFRGLKPENLVLVFAKGDSMEPTISDNNTLMIDTSNRDLADGQIYVIRVNSHLVVKRVQTLLNRDIMLLSDNKEYHPETLNPDQLEDLEVIGKVVWIGKDV